MLPSIATAIMAGSPDAVLVLDADGRYQEANPAACHLLGYARDELLRLHNADVIPEDAPWLAEAQATYRAEGSWRGEIALVRKDGTLVPVEAWSVVIPSPNGPLAVSFLRDLTDQKRGEAADARLAALVQSSADAIISLSLEGRIIAWNPAAERLYGYTAEEAIGQPVTMLTPPERVHESDHVLAQVRAGASITGLETVRRTKDGRRVEVALTAAPVRDAVGEVVASSGIVRDITDRKQAEEDLRGALDAAQAANQAKGVFLDLMSHELRTPLQAVMGYSEFLLWRSQDSLTDAQREDLGYIHQGGNRMLTLINQVLDLSRMEAGGIDLMIKPFDLSQVIEAVRQDVAPQAAAKGLAVEITLAPSLPRITGDAERVRQILLNLAGNAVTFTTEGRVCITATPMSSGGVEVVVSDTGVGIPAEALPHIFEAFQQVESGLTRRYEGSGLGLAIAWKLAQQMGGTITVSSEPGVGSTFQLHLPNGASLSA